MLFETREEWKQARWGKFTASEIYRLAEPASPRAKSNRLFGDAGMSYIFEVAVQCCTNFNEDEAPETWQMKMGHRDEPLAAAHLHRIIGIDKPLQYFDYANPYFEPYGPNAGASPDCLLPYRQRIELGADLKCKTSKVYTQLALDIREEKDLREQQYQAWCQGQFSNMVFGASKWLWCAFCDHFPMKEKMFIIEIPADPLWHADMQIRLAQAVKIRDEIIQSIKKRLN